jgi:hypothetical protein
LPITKHINVMVGMIRNKIIFIINYFLDIWNIIIIIIINIFLYYFGIYFIIWLKENEMNFKELLYGILKN